MSADFIAVLTSLLPCTMVKILNLCEKNYYVFKKQIAIFKNPDLLVCFCVYPSESCNVPDR